MLEDRNDNHNPYLLLFHPPKGWVERLLQHPQQAHVIRDTLVRCLKGCLFMNDGDSVQAHIVAETEDADTLAFLASCMSLSPRQEDCYAPDDAMTENPGFSYVNLFDRLSDPAFVHSLWRIMPLSDWRELLIMTCLHTWPVCHGGPLTFESVVEPHGADNEKRACYLIFKLTPINMLRSVSDEQQDQDGSIALGMRYLEEYALLIAREKNDADVMGKMLQMVQIRRERRR